MEGPSSNGFAFIMNCRGFTLVEVIVALVVLSSAIISFGAAFNMYTKAQFKHEHYQDVYITAVSLKNAIETKSLLDEPQGDGQLNGFQYFFKSEKIKSAQNYVHPMDPAPGGNIGPFEIVLYKVNLKLRKQQWNREFSFYVTQYKGNPGLLKEF